MKKSISFILAWMFYYIGHITYLTLVKWGCCYGIYAWFMDNSEKIQTWGENNSPWK